MVSLCLVQLDMSKVVLLVLFVTCHVQKPFFNVDPPKEDIFVTTLYGLYFNSDVIHVTNFYLGL